MKEERLLKIIGEADDKFVEEAQPAYKGKKPIIKVLIVAACLCLVFFAGLKILKTPKEPGIVKETQVSEESKLPLPAINKVYDFNIQSADSSNEIIKINSDMLSMGTGFSGVMFYSEDELKAYVGESTLSGNSLPVYKTMNYSDMRNNIFLNEIEIKELAGQVALLLNETDAVVAGAYLYNADGSIKECYQATSLSENYNICVSSDGSVDIYLNEPKALNNYSFYGDAKTEDEEALETLKYLERIYSKLVDIETPEYEYKMEKIEDDYTYLGEKEVGYHRNYIIYDNSSGHNGRFKNYIEFCPDDNGCLACIKINFPLAGKVYMGDYPIISEGEARNKLLSQDYISNVPSEYLKDGLIYEDNIKAVSFEYRNDEYTLPYYCFYVELDYDFNAVEGLKTYGMFYVPAVEDQYLEIVEVYDGSIN